MVLVSRPRRADPGSRDSRAVSDGRSQLRRVMVSEDGSVIATGSAGGSIKVYDAQTGKFLYGFHAQEGGVKGVAFLGGQNLV
jgi:WD40 repeat protein